jgi:hypothetical protein
VLAFPLPQLINESMSAIHNFAAIIPSFRAKLTILAYADYRIINTHEGQEAYSQRDSSCPLPDLWCCSGREVRTHHGTAPYRAASGPTIACSGLIVACIEHQQDDDACDKELRIPDAGLREARSGPLRW